MGEGRSERRGRAEESVEGRERRGERSVAKRSELHNIIERKESQVRCYGTLTPFPHHFTPPLSLYITEQMVFYVH